METSKSIATPNILFKFADLLGTEIKNGRLGIPPKYGQGFCAGFVFNEHIRLLISNYELNEDVVIENPELDTSRQMIFFKFQDVFVEKENELVGSRQARMPSVLIGTSRINTDDFISIHTHTSTVNIEVDAGYLDKVLSFTEKSPLLKGLLQNTQPLLFEQVVFPSLRKVVDEIVCQSVGEVFQLYFLRIKSEELICRLLIELEKRNEKRLYALNKKDMQAIYNIKERLLHDLSVPPQIGDLATAANMSPTKLKTLFRQIFGNTIFRYYQEFRMKEAARLLKDEKLSVSEVGYQLGFSNLSHFSRVFEEHIGMKPKKYRTGG